MASAMEAKIQELVKQYGYDEQVLREFAEFAQAQPKPRKKSTSTDSKSKRPKPKEPTMAELQAAVVAAFNCSDVKELKKHEAFKLAIAGLELDLRKKDGWLILYREWVGVPENERHEEGPTCINGIDVLKNFRPWHVFSLEPKTATSDDINTAFRRLAMQHHPDHGGNREVFERLQKMRDSLLAFR
ncbi:J domain-containing protein [Trichocoleus desertorum AS-A10]|uniref:J domain-containing protein n=1 Tax=Trichocoleus desertorum TaxID=1481672 RepID=UPI0032972BA7